MKLVMKKSNFFGALAFAGMAYCLPVLFSVLTLHSIISRNTPLGQWENMFKLILVMFIFATFVSLFFFGTVTGFIRITKDGIEFKAPLRKTISYSWNEIVSCGMDYFQYSSYTKKQSTIKMVYVSRKEVVPLDYHANGRINPFWNEFLKKNKANWSVQKERKILLIFEVYGNQLAEFKAYLPEHLLKQLESSEERLYSVHPSLK